MEKQVWINGVETNYVVSDEGIIKNGKTNREIKIKDGYVQLTIDGKHSRYSVGKIVLETFEGSREKGLVNHKDGDRMNNRLENLEWISDKQNALNVWEKRRENGTINAGQKLNRKKRENIVEKQNYALLENEKQIEIDGELIPYAISKDGKVRNLKTGKYLSGSILQSYRYINFRYEGKNKNRAVHRLVAQAFIDNPNNYSIVDHIDGDRLNNNLENLRWVSAKENRVNVHLDKTPVSPEFEEIIFSKEEEDNEEWKEYEGFLVSNLGRIKGRNGRILSGHRNISGYIQYGGDHYLGQVLVWEAFNGKKNPGNVINHINGNKHDNRLSNLEEVTHQENMVKASEETNAWGFREVGEFDENGTMLRKFANASVAAREIGILPGSMRNTIRRNGKCYNGLSYRYLDNR